ncbi:MAG: radical SAM protein [Cytophagales bacterium]|nr:MAG: radical SAM protein [Cytophagales bacterium]
MKFLLTTLNAKYIHINLAIRLLYELNKNYKGLEMKEFTIKEPKQGIADFCADFEVIAFSCYIWNITQTLEVCRLIKLINPNAKILLGGPEVSYDYEDVICLPEIDYIIVGEGENPFREFLEQYPKIEKVSNLVRKDDEKVIFVPKAANFDLKLYAGINPYSNDTPEELYNKVCYVETSRGCPYKCEFCLASLDNQVRYLPMDDIKSNLLYLMQHGRVIKFLDRTFNIKKVFTIEIFDFIVKNHKPQNVFQFEITADILHPDIIQYIHDFVPHGLFRFEIGIQTVNQKANLEVQRKQSFDKTKNIIKTLDYKVEMHLDLIVGMALDYWEDIKYSFEEVFKLYAPELQLGFLKFLKGTPVRHKAEQHGFIYEPNPPYQIIESKYLSKNQLFEITLVEEILEIYWNKKRAIHTLKYITENNSIFDFMLELGKYFASKQDFHKHTLANIYDILNDFAKEIYPQDLILHQLIAIDYYLQSKIKPQIKYINEIERSQKHDFISKYALDHHKFRHIIIPINFNFEEYLLTRIIENGTFECVFEYNGVEKPKLIPVVEKQYA